MSDITLFELAVLVAKGRIQLDISLESLLREVEARFVVFPIGSRTCVLASSGALVEGISLVTADWAIRGSQALHTIW